MEKQIQTIRKRSFCYLFFGLLCTLTVSGQNDVDSYLKKVLGNLEKIESASYCVELKAWEPGDTVPACDEYKFNKEYTNPKDTTIGSCYVVVDESARLEWGYDGKVKATTYHDQKVIVIDDFTHRNLPFRLVGPPFFNYTRSLVRYVLETTDSISTTLKEFEDHYYLSLVIHEDRQVEFFGKAYYMPLPPFDMGDPTSRYELWISKSNDLPYKYRREMSHSISTEECSDVTLNNLSIEDFDLYGYFPADYEIHKYGEKRNQPAKPELLDKKAPDWTLKNAVGQTFSLSDFKESKVLLVQCTGIGCGPCMISIPFLNKLKQDYKTDELDVVAIETWGRKAHSLQNYADKHHIQYTFLEGNDAVVDAYKTGRAAPFFFILDKQRVIRDIIQGYSKDKTDQEITNVVNNLISE